MGDITNLWHQPEGGQTAQAANLLLAGLTLLLGPEAPRPWPQLQNSLVGGSGLCTFLGLGCPLREDPLPSSLQSQLQVSGQRNV